MFSKPTFQNPNTFNSFGQQPQKQQQQQNLFGMSNSQQQAPQQPSRFAKYALKAEQPGWIADEHNGLQQSNTGIDQGNNGTISSSRESDTVTGIKRRVIPRKLIRRVHKTESESMDDDKTNIPSLPFRTRHTKEENNKQDDANAWDSYNHLDRPPTKTLHDLRGPVEDNDGSSLVIDNADFRELMDRPAGYVNAFNRYHRTRIDLPQSKHSSGPQRPDVPFSVSQPGSTETVDHKQNGIAISRPNESAVIVYGFSDSNFDLMISHFAKFGTIVEDFHDSSVTDLRNSQILPMILMNEQRQREEAERMEKTNNDGGSSNAKLNGKSMMRLKSYPIFVGHGWVKITYQSPSSAVRALRENGSHDDQQSVIGVVPYTRNGVEKLLNHKIPDDLDVGHGLASLHIDPEDLQFPEDRWGIGEILKKSFIESGAMSTGKDGSGKTINADIMQLKDGSNLINSRKNQKKKKTGGFTENAIRFFFGTGAL